MNWDIMMSNENKDFPELDSFFTAARKQGAQPSDGLIKRISEQAAQAQAGFRPTGQKPQSPGRMAQLFRLLGGWPAMGGLALATAAGIWIGIAPPGLLTDGFSQVAMAFLELDDTAYFIDIAPGSEFDLGEEAL